VELHPSVGTTTRPVLSGVASAREGKRMTDLRVDGNGVAGWGRRMMQCAVGRAGIATLKREGDDTTPAGSFTIRRGLYRTDRERPPRTRLALAALNPADGWCDAPSDPAYKQLVRLPHRSSAEPLWRTDGLFDLMVVIGFNDAPVVPDRGSTIFLHLAAPDFAPTKGCIALGREDLLAVIVEADFASRVIVAR
jgi:L,D-peptidoglycan transpeptidase YkuD (ErfK/YbiS/YcfS/YnhG family)